MPGAGAVTHAPPSEKGLALAWRALQEREKMRAYLAKRTKDERGPSPPPGHPSPEHVYYSVDNSRAEANRANNRYSDILAYDRTMVFAGTGEGRYLNANVIVDPVGHWWVAAQAPLPHTHYDFFHAIHSRAASRSPALPKPGRAHVARPSAIVVQLTNWAERGFIKADPYLPKGTSAADERVFVSKTGAPIRMRMSHKSDRPDIGCTYAALHLNSAGAADMEVHHYLFRQWPDYGVPTGAAVGALKRLLKEVHDQREGLGGQDECELWVHCSAGIGRTGTFLTLMSVNLPDTNEPLTPPPAPSPLGPPPPPIAGDPVATCVDAMRDCRNHLVQTPDQLRFIYTLTAEWSESK